MLSKESISTLINERVGVYVYDTVTSTNDVARELCSDDGCILVVADGQTNGKGRQGKSFFSPHDSGLYFSLAIDTDSPAFDFTGVTCAVAVAVSRAILKVAETETKIKWVNDLYLGDRKVCGILVQAVNENGRIRKLIIGVGINISTIDFPDEIKDIAGSLGKNVDRNVLTAESVNNILELIFAKSEEYIDEYRSKSNVIGREITYIQNGISHTATAVDIDQKGGLVVRNAKETITLTSGEISVRFR
ncbi:MAG: biotin--[acetyl-CoA-carboxylase] ligase [Acutalibacteraceae bacterium]|nr:biotin--[acetyl-CoA-carboxylase] ligase [Acutalibacteraceae bacterium]